MKFEGFLILKLEKNGLIHPPLSILLEEGAFLNIRVKKLSFLKDSFSF